MNTTLLELRFKQCLALSEMSSCRLQRSAALLLDPEGSVLMDCYNGPQDGGLCSGSICRREKDLLPLDSFLEIGCLGVEALLICKAARAGISTTGNFIVTSSVPNLMSAKLIHHVGIVFVAYLFDSAVSSDEGLEYLRQNNIETKGKSYELE